MAGKAKLIIARKGGKYSLHLLIFLEKVGYFSLEICMSINTFVWIR